MLDRLTIERMEAAGGGPILIALSGGGDSVALLHLLVEHFGAARLRAAVIDHALREGSAQDAARAADFAAALGVAAGVLTLTWSGVPSRSQEATRQARYAALCRHARTLGACVIAVAHSSDDQLETLMMRAAAGSGERGLAGMRAFAPAPLWPEGRGLWIARPLLGVRRAALRDYLRERNAAWIEDPTNTNTAFERVRVRQSLAEQEAANGYQLAPMLMAANDLRERAERLDAGARALIVAAAQFDADTITIDRKTWRGPSDVRQRALSALITAAAGATREPPPRAVARLLARLDDPEFPVATLGGAAFSPRGDFFRITRDPGALAGRAGVAPLAPLELAPKAETVWDGRLALTVVEAGWSVVFDGRGTGLQRGEETLPLAAASPHWLVKNHVEHLLGRD
jgi:tRNA(Ile)-lysidine synthase